MKVSEIIRELKSMGYEIESRQRSDGGVLITSINGVKYHASTGNQVARSILGISLSSARQEQLSYNVSKYIKGKKKPKDKFDDDIKRAVKRVQRKWWKNKTHGTAKITMRKARYHFRTEGRQATLDYLSRMERYSEGYAYEENVRYLSDYASKISYGSSDANIKSLYEELANTIDGMRYTFKEEWISKIYQLLYEIVGTGYNSSKAMQNYALIKQIIGM